MSDLFDPDYCVSDLSGDLKIEAWGRDCLEALAHASLALVNQIVSIEQIREIEERSFVVSGDHDADRFIAFLNELLYLVYTKRWLPRRVRLLKQCGTEECRELQAVLVGEAFDPERHETKYDIKAVIYHDFQIRNESNRVTVQFVCDL